MDDSQHRHDESDDQNAFPQWRQNWLARPIDVRHDPAETDDSRDDVKEPKVLRQSHRGLVPGVRVELTRTFWVQRVLSPQRLPVPPPRRRFARDLPENANLSCVLAVAQDFKSDASASSAPPAHGDCPIWRQHRQALALAATGGGAGGAAVSAATGPLMPRVTSQSTIVNLHSGNLQSAVCNLQCLTSPQGASVWQPGPERRGAPRAPPLRLGLRPPPPLRLPPPPPPTTHS